MKKTKKLIAVLLIVCTIVPMTACGLFKKENTTEQQTQAQEEQTQGEQPQGTSTKLELPEKLISVLVGSIDANSIIDINNKGFCYKADNEKSGVATLDGKKDTGPKYDICNVEEDFFVVASKMSSSSSSNISAMNCCGLIDAEGKSIIPEKYASIEVLNERYAKAITITGVTTSEDEALLFSSDRQFSVTYSQGDTLYKGKWIIYDLATKKVVNGVEGKKNTSIVAKGNYIEYTTDNNERKCVNDKVSILPQNAKLFEDGSYKDETASSGTVYATDGTKLFEYNPNDYSVDSVENGYYIASKYVNDQRSYIILDKTGAIVSKEFNETITIYGDLIKCNKKIYDFSGKNVIEGTFTYVYFDELTRSCWCLQNGEDCTFIDKNGTVMLKCTNGADDISVYSSSFTAYKKADYGNALYCVKDEGYTINGNTFTNFMGKTSNSGGKYAIVDLISGATLIEGYQSYTSQIIEQNGCYVYAEKPEGGFDIFQVK